MNHIPHTNTAPMRPTAAQVMRDAVIREDARKQRRDSILVSATHAVYCVMVVLGTIAIAIN